jgi:ribosomal protein S18 acetylase RimI-like enzyme
MVNPASPFEIVVTSSASSIDFDRLAEFSDRAWRKEYAGKPRALYDRDFLTWLLSGEHWYAVLALTKTGQPVGSFFSLLRTLRHEGGSIPALYSTGWAVDPAYRRNGVSLMLWQTHRTMLRERGCADVTTLHVGHSAARAGGVLRESGAQRGSSNEFHTGSIWSRRLTDEDAAKPQPRILRQRLHVAGEAGVNPGEAAGSNGENFTALLDRTSTLSYAPSANFSQLYMNRKSGRSGTLCFTTADGSQCAMGFSTHTLAYEGTPMGDIGRIQFAVCDRCDDDDLLAALESTCAFLAELECFSVSVVDQNCIPLEVLRRGGFEETSDSIAFRIWTPESLAGRFVSAKPPFAFDFL